MQIFPEFPSSWKIHNMHVTTVGNPFKNPGFAPVSKCVELKSSKV